MMDDGLFEKVLNAHFLRSLALFCMDACKYRVKRCPVTAEREEEVSKVWAD
jgi:hypothetical protein